MKDEQVQDFIESLELAIEQEERTGWESLVDRFTKEWEKKQEIKEINKEVLENIAPKTKKHQEICDKLNKVYADKNHDYGDSFAISYYLFGMTGVLQRLFDKWIRMYMLQFKSQKVNDENIVDSLRDLTNYSIMTLIELENDNPDDPAKKMAKALKELAEIE